MSRVRPIGPRVLVQVDPDEKELDSGLLIGPGMVERDDVLCGTVIAPSPMKHSELDTGDRVWFGKECGFKVNDKPEVIIIQERHIDLAYTPGGESA